MEKTVDIEIVLEGNGAPSGFPPHRQRNIAHDNPQVALAIQSTLHYHLRQALWFFFEQGTAEEPDQDIPHFGKKAETALRQEYGAEEAARLMTTQDIRIANRIGAIWRNYDKLDKDVFGIRLRVDPTDDGNQRSGFKS